MFLQLICDRAFLFLNDSKHLNCPDYPTLRDICFNSNVSSFYESDKVALVKEQGFIPTTAHKSEWEQWQDSCKKLAALIEQRTEHIDHNQRASVLDFDIRLSAPTEPVTPTKAEKKLADLFTAYLSALAKTAYRKEYESVIPNAYNNALSWIHAICHNAQCQSPNAPCMALLLWTLFVVRPKKLAAGILREYRFRLTHTAAQSDRADIPPEQMQENQSRKIRCDIILFDHLLDLVPPEDKEYAKFQFYAFSRYDRFTHYKTTLQQYRDFTCLPDLTDGVDRLGCMLRYHMEHCFMTTPAWLSLPAPSLSSKPLLNSLTSLLLYDATLLPSKRRLTDRIRLFLDDGKVGDDAVERYLNCNGDDEAITKLLDCLLEQHNLHFLSTHAFSGADTLNDPNIQQCENFVLEHALKIRSYKELYDNLYNRARELFSPKLFLSERVFWV